MKTRSKNSPRGFTLIELLVAMAITTIIVTVLVSVTALALDTWNRSRAEVRAARQAKAMIDSMARDFESFVSRKGNNFEWLHAKSEPPADGPNDQISPNAVDLIFFSAATDRYDGNIGAAFPDNNGDVSTVGYRLAYKDPIAGEDEDNYKTFVLYRKIVNPDDTFANILGKEELRMAFDAVGNSIEEESNFICENVYQFTVSFHVSLTKADGTTSSISVPVGLGASAAEEFSVMGTGIESTFIPAGLTIDDLKAGRLTGAEISITVLSDFGLQQMRRRSFSDAELEEFIAKNSYQYSKLVSLPGS